MGHIFPAYVGFAEAKGFTMLGILVGVHPQAALVCAGVGFWFFSPLVLFLSAAWLQELRSGGHHGFYSTNSNIIYFPLPLPYGPHHSSAQY